MEPVSDSLIDRFAREALRLRTEYEFRTFWLGTRLAGPVTAEEAIALKREVNRRVGERIERTAPDLVATLESPEARIALVYPEGRAEIARLKPLFVYGRYRKLSREIPQSRWPCRWCRGKGCGRCKGTGKTFQRSVEELVAAPILAACRATGTKMHATGREDVDARMLGQGRPFVLELAMPRVRTFDLAPIQDEINHACPGSERPLCCGGCAGEVEVEQLQFGDQALCQRVTLATPDKSYRMQVDCLAPARREAVERLARLRDAVLTQETPRRVLHRRPNLTRRRTVRNCSVEIAEGGDEVRRFRLTLRVQSGAYVKEFVSGDEGRTRPSIAQLLGVPCDCAELDVLEVHCDPLRDG